MSWGFPSPAGFGGKGVSYATVFAQVMLRLPSVALWLDRHAEMCRLGVRCLACGLRNSRGQLGRVAPAAVVFRARMAGPLYKDMSCEHEVCRFFSDALEAMRVLEVRAGRCGAWDLPGDPLASHVDRIFGFLVEERWMCKSCKCLGRSFRRGLVYEVTAPEAAGEMLVTDMYLQSCVPQDVTRVCASGVCKGQEATHEVQKRLSSLPNVLILSVRRGGGGRPSAIVVEEQISFPGLGALVLGAVVFALGASGARLRYACACRAPDGDFWFFDAQREPWRLGHELSNVLRRSVVMLVYTKPAGKATFAGDGSERGAGWARRRGVGGASAGEQVTEAPWRAVLAARGRDSEDVDGVGRMAQDGGEAGGSGAAEGIDIASRGEGATSSIGRDVAGQSGGEGQRRKEFASPSLSSERPRVVQRRQVVGGETQATPKQLRRTLSYMPPTPEEAERWGRDAWWRGDADVPPTPEEVGGRGAAASVRGDGGTPQSENDGVDEVTLGLARSGLHGDTPEVKPETPGGGEAVEELAAQLAGSHLEGAGSGVAASPVEGDREGGERKSVAAEEWRRYTPRVIDGTKCMARTFDDGVGGQCKNWRGPGGRYCRMHARKEGTPGWHGDVEGKIPARKLEEFRRRGKGRPCDEDMAEATEGGDAAASGVRGSRVGNAAPGIVSKRATRHGVDLEEAKSETAAAAGAQERSAGGQPEAAARPCEEDVFGGVAGRDDVERVGVEARSVRGASSSSAQEQGGRQSGLGGEQAAEPGSRRSTAPGLEMEGRAEPGTGSMEEAWRKREVDLGGGVANSAEATVSVGSTGSWSVMGEPSTQGVVSEPSPGVALGAEPVLDAEQILGYSAVAGIPQDRRVARLRNLGNTCYLNATLSALSSIPLVVRWACGHERAQRESQDHDSERCALCLLGRDIRTIRASRELNAIEPAVARARGQWSLGAFDNLEQQDANEAFNFLMRAADEVDWETCVALAPGVAMQIPGHSNPRYSTPYYKIFGGALRRSKRCRLCNYTGVLGTPDPFVSIAVEFPVDARPRTVDELVQRFRTPERPSDYYCDSCGRRGTTETSLEIARWPRVLCVQLKRFAYCRREDRMSKVYTRVEWQEHEILHGGLKACPYRLRCLVNHGGNAFDGHYNSYVRGHGGEWYFCDDAVTPRRVDLGEVLRCEGYLAFYEKEGAAPN